MDRQSQLSDWCRSWVSRRFEATSLDQKTILSANAGLIRQGRIMRWYVEQNGKISGPFGPEALRTLIANGEVDNSCRVRSVNEVGDTWRPPGEVPELGASLPMNLSFPPASAPLVHADRATLNIERLEKVARSLLWLTLAATTVAVPLALAKERRAEADTHQRIADATRAAEQKLASFERASADKNARLTLASIGNRLTTLSTENASAQLWFTNVSARAGYVCVIGEVTNGATHALATSLPACAQVSAYSSAVHLTVMFPASDLNAACKGGPCSLQMKDAPGFETPNQP